ncbi:Clp protease N-terminal domain-containing protein [Nocardioides sp. 1609]|uniref:Clp protease N-terminal domain-containing protein n=1 Tax=Nocardioides sp. 1609 TaxID=2508327 RepID=UPI00106FAE92|nr:Clp protease N-terminal domain-containing protein [Nocardioides sp. 1609]
MTDRRDVHPHHLLRAVLADRPAREVLAAVGVAADDVLLTLDGLWLAASDTIDVEEVQARGIDVATVLAVVNPPFEGEPDWGGRRVTDATRDVLVRSLAMRRAGGARPVTSGHLLLGLLASRDRLVSGTFRAHGLRLRDVRPVVDRLGRRAP